MKKNKLTIDRPDAGGGSMECDGFVLLAWNVGEDGMKIPVLHTSSPFEDDGSDVVHTVGALALLMEKHDSVGVKMMGRNVRAIMTKGFEMLESAASSEVPEA
jgi:hypothetical protein